MNRQEQDWQAVLEQARNGDNGAFGKLFDEYLKTKVILPYAKELLRNAENAEDIAQDVARKLFEGKYYTQPTIATIAQLTNYVKSMTHNDCINRLKKISYGATTAARQALKDHAQSSADSISQAERTRRECEVIEAARRQLSQEDQQMIDLLFQGLTFRQIAQQFNKPLTTVHSRYQRLLNMLRTNQELRACWEMMEIITHASTEGRGRAHEQRPQHE